MGCARSYATVKTKTKTKTKTKVGSKYDVCLYNC